MYNVTMAMKKSPWERVREVTSWHSLSGYLDYKSSGPLGKLKGSTRLWFILEDSSSLLLYYKNKEEATRQKEPRGKIPLQGAGIALDPKQVNQFIVICGEKEHYFLADNHESMMVWLMGLQAKRDFFLNKRLGISTQTGSHKQPIQEEYEVIHTPPNDERRLEETVSKDKTCQNDRTDADNSPPPSATQKTKSLFGEAVRSLTTSTLDLYRRQRNQSQWRQQRLRKILGESMDGGLDLYKEQEYIFEDLKPGMLAREMFNIHHSTGRQSQSTSLSNKHCQYNSLSNLVSEDSVFVADSVFSADEALVTKNSREDSPKPSCIQKACSEGMDVNNGVVGSVYRDTQRRSGSGRSGSSDSLLDRNSENELISQLNELEQQLINTKCEMAVLMNRETCFKEVLERRDSIIIELDEKLEELSRRKEENQKSLDKKLKEEIRQLQNQNRFLNEEVRRLTQLRQKEYDNMQSHNIRVQELLATIEKWKRDYVYLLQSCISIPTGDVIDGMEVNLYGGSRHKERVLELLEECRQTNPCLPVYERLARSEVHIDQYGFKHSYKSEELLLHYICQQLHIHYQCRLESWDEHQRHWKALLRKSGQKLNRTKELKQLCRRGIPDHYRAEVWKKLVYGQVADIVEEKGPHYYSHLVNVAYDSQYAGRYRKQIMLDLLRTMPSNVNFNSKDSEGIMRMGEVLQAFCMHNPDIGYCQGLNFIVGMCLLFLDTEDAFWTLVAITERYFSSNYFDKTLTGAQADQEVLKDILKDKLPEVAEHLNNIDIELSTVTFNWFLAIFFDAVPFQTLIRIWDCFLAEGPKVLFRFSLAIIKMNQSGILCKKDTINVMRHLKVCGKLMFDTDGLVQVAFVDLKPFPRRRDIAAKQVVYLNALKEKLKKREAYRRTLEEKNKMLDELDMIPPSALVYECAAACGNDLAWVCVSEQNYGKIMSVLGTEALARDTNIEVESHILSACCLEDEIFLIGTLSRILHAYSIKLTRELWCLTLNDSIFSLCVMMSDYTNRLFAGMGDGTVAIIDQIQPKEPQDEPFYIPLGRSPVTAMVWTGSKVWMACGNAIHILHSQSLDMLDKIVISTNPFDHVLMLAESSDGIWTTIKGSSVLELWDSDQLTCKLLYDVTTNNVIPKKNDDDGSLNKQRITTLLPFSSLLWVGTGDGLLTTYTIQDRCHLRQNGVSRDPPTPRHDRHRRQQKHGQGAKTKAERRMSREWSRSQEMLLNGMMDDDDEEDVSLKEKRPRLRVRDRHDKMAETREARLARRSRSREMKQRAAAGGQDAVGKNSSTKASQPNTKSNGKEARGKPKGTEPRKKTSPDQQNGSHPNGLSATAKNSESKDKQPEAKTKGSGLERKECGTPNDKSSVDPQARLKSMRSIRLQRQKDLSQNNTSPPETPCRQKGEHIERRRTIGGDHVTNAETATQTAARGSRLKEKPRDESVDDDVFHPASPVADTSDRHLKTGSATTSQEKEAVLAARKGHAEATPPEKERQHHNRSVSLGAQQASDRCETGSATKRQLPHLLRSALGKTHAPPEESPVRAACSKPSSSSGTDDDSNTDDDADGQRARKGLVHDDSYSAEVQESRDRVGEVTQAGHGSSKKRRTTRSSTASADSTSGSSKAGSARSVVSVVTAHDVDKLSDVVPEIEIEEYEAGQLSRNVSKSLEALDQPALPQAPSVLGVSAASDVFGGSTPDLRNQRLRPPPANRRSDHVSATASSSTMSSSSFGDLTYFIDLSIQTRVKVSDRPVKCLVPVSYNGTTVVLSCAGCYGDDEAVLKWTKKAGESIWTNEPVPEVCPYTNMPRRPSYMKHMAVERSLST